MFYYKKVDKILYKGILMKYSLTLFLIISNAFANQDIFLSLEKEKASLINKYSERIFEAKQNSLKDRVTLLDKTLRCFVNSMSKRDITNCKVDERKRIMELIK